MLNKYDRQTARHKRLIHAQTENKKKYIFLPVRAAFQLLRRKHSHSKIVIITGLGQDQDQDSLLVKRRNDNHSPGPVIRELVPSSHQRSEFSNTILCIFSG